MEVISLDVCCTWLRMAVRVGAAVKASLRAKADDVSATDTHGDVPIQCVPWDEVEIKTAGGPDIVALLRCDSALYPRVEVHHDSV